ncbi:MAG: hypothetical protein JKY34_01265 [Kordiimonadaceae bacterium]|nr:hypothetical protein [Kordiimonadaceae bacterium]
MTVISQLNPAIPCAWERSQVQAFLTEAAWTLSKVPDTERRHVYAGDYMGGEGDYPEESTRTRPTPKQIDLYLPVLAWLEYLPSLFDRALVFRVVASFNGEPLGENERIRWTKLRKRNGWHYGRHTLLRHYNASLDLIAGNLTAEGVKTP